jgi:hypothetical protein
VLGGEMVMHLVQLWLMVQALTIYISLHDTLEMLAGAVEPPGVFFKSERKYFVVSSFWMGRLG